MTGWLSATWEANWRSFQYFNLFRLILAILVALAVWFPQDWAGQLFGFSPSALLSALVSIHVMAVLAGLFVSINWQFRFNLQLSTQVVVDVIAIGLLMFVAGGVGSGLGVLLLVSLAAASLVGRGHLVLFYAAISTLSVLVTQIYGFLGGIFDVRSVVQAGILSAGFFATAILARLLGQWAMANEELARRRGEALENQMRISQRVVERMQDGVLIVDRDGFIGRYNPVAQVMLGLPKRESLPLSEVAPTLAAARTLWQTGVGMESIQLSGHEGCELAARFEQTNSLDGEALIFLEDLGRVKEQAQQLKLASLGRLTASIAHEIRNPLSAISHAGELLREERRGEMQDRLLRIMHDNVIRLDGIVRDILDVGRQSRAEPELLNLGDFCASFVQGFVESESLAPELVRVPPRLPLGLNFDRSHLHQVLWNLLSNAYRHSSKAPGSVCIQLSVGNSEGRVELHVTDDGPGVPPEARDQIFEPFFTTHTQGTGLGLFIARELCVANGASLELLPTTAGAHFVISGRNDTCLLPELKDAHAVR